LYVSTTKALEFKSHKKRGEYMSKASDVDIHYQKKRLESAFEKGFSGKIKPM
jgi:hypothetical protein